MRLAASAEVGFSDTAKLDLTHPALLTQPTIFWSPFLKGYMLQGQEDGVFVTPRALVEHYISRPSLFFSLLSNTDPRSVCSWRVCPPTVFPLFSPMPFLSTPPCRAVRPGALIPYREA